MDIMTTTGKSRIAIIQARMGSRRLSGKVLLPTIDGPMLGHMIHRLGYCNRLDGIVVATTWRDQDDAICAMAAGCGVGYTRGSEDDVLDRVLDSARSCNAEIIVELTGDCPVIDPRIVDDAVTMFEANSHDVVTNAVHRVHPDGMDVVVYALSTLESQAELVTTDYDREHVSTFMLRYPELFPTLHLGAPLELTWPELGLTLDEESDYQLLLRIVDYFYPRLDYGLADILHMLRHVHPELLDLNRSVKRIAVQ